MIRDRLPDVLRLARRNPNKYYEPEHQPDVAMDPAASLVLQRADKVIKFLHEMEEMLTSLSAYQRGVAMSAAEEKRQREQITATMNRFTALARKTKTVLNRIDLSEAEKLKYHYHISARGADSDDEHDDEERSRKMSVSWSQKRSKVKVTWSDPERGDMDSRIATPAEVRMKITLHEVLSYRLTELVKKYYTAQKKLNDLNRKKIERQLAILGKGAEKTAANSLERQLTENSQGQKSKASDEGEQVPLLHGQVIDDLQISKEQRARLEQTEHFEREILALERSITQLHQAFVTISTLVHEQGAMVDRIEYHLTASADYIESSKQQLKKATKLQHKYRKKRCCVILLVISIIAIVALVIFLSVHKWNQPAPSHRHMAIYAHVRPTRSHWSGKEPLPHF